GQIMGNSMKYEASEITVTAEDFPDKTVLHFRDNGCGIPEHDMPYIFEKSFTGENGRTHRKSTGMGLYIVKNLCDKLGHSVAAKSVQGAFTEIIITFGKNDIHDVR
ncbi:MAG: ATP-binding protein, partial [Acutalibacteraceae bacterium]|nr:ATP-binding protein [Acutalibacteraceae bacterium]